MIVLDISCDNCRSSDCFPLGTKLSTVRKFAYHINGKDYCANCVTKALIGLNYIPYGTELIKRDLTKAEKAVVHNFYCL
jgi:hypothetical protein